MPNPAHFSGGASTSSDERIACRILTSHCISGGNAMTPPRRRFLHLAAGAAALPIISRMARAQTYPSRPIKIIVPFPAGGNVDFVARLVGEGISRELGQPIVVDI